MGKVGEDLQTVKEVLNRISISKEEKQKNVAEAVEKTVKEKLIPLMKEESALFKALFNRVVHSGSFYDNVRISNAGEFDLNIVLDFSKYNYVLDANAKPRHVIMSFMDQDTAMFEECKRRLFCPVQTTQGPYHPSTAKTRQWFEGLAIRVCNKNPSLFSGKPFTWRKSGPALTLELRNDAKEIEIEIDLVPAIRIPLQLLKVKPEAFFKIQNLRSHIDFQIIPKSPNENDTAAKVSSTSEKEWQLSFPEQEKEILTGPNNLKQCIKLLKYFRDCSSSLSGISSYALKTVVIHLHHDTKANINMWNSQRELPKVFLEALAKLKEFLEHKHLPYYFDGHCNLLPKAWLRSDDTCKIKATFLQKKIKDLQMTGPQRRATWRSSFDLDSANLASAMGAVAI